MICYSSRDVQRTNNGNGQSLAWLRFGRMERIWSDGVVWDNGMISCLGTSTDHGHKANLPNTVVMRVLTILGLALFALLLLLSARFLIHGDSNKTYATQSVWRSEIFLPSAIGSIEFPMICSSVRLKCRCQTKRAHSATLVGDALARTGCHTREGSIQTQTEVFPGQFGNQCPRLQTVDPDTGQTVDCDVSSGPE